MTENEAKAFLEIEKQCINRNCDRNCAKCDIVQKVEDLNSAYDTAIKALEEVQQYRQIGTVSTCRNAVGICKAMIERGINPDNIIECIKFEYNLVQRGYDLKKLIEMIEEHKQQFQIGTVEECLEAVEKQKKGLSGDEAKIIAAKAICCGCGYLADCKCDYNGGNCMVSKPMLESVLKLFDDWNRRLNDGETD